MEVNSVWKSPRGAFELTKCNEMNSIAHEVGSTKFTDIALGKDFIPYYSGGWFGKKEVGLKLSSLLTIDNPAFVPSME